MAFAFGCVESFTSLKTLFEKKVRKRCLDTGKRLRRTMGRSPRLHSVDGWS